MVEEKSVADVPRAEPLAEAWRGPLAESIHRGHVAAVDGAGRLAASAGDPEASAFMRSSSKPHQALPLVTTGAADRFRFDAAELALACGSHNGERIHTEAVRSMLAKMGLGVEALRCGAHEPYGKLAAAELRDGGGSPTPLHHNCSGKHAGMLAVALQLGAPPENYFEPGHPVQREILRVVSLFSGVPASRIETGTDGCGVPTFALPVRAMALMFARLVSPPDDWDAATRAACGRVVAAIIAHPEMVEGDGELDTELMRAAGGALVSKVGAEGVYAAGAIPSAEWPAGLGVAFKLADGDRQGRARPPVAVEVLRQLGLLKEAAAGTLERFARPPIRNHRGDAVGEVRAAFRLEKVRP